MNRKLIRWLALGAGAAAACMLAVPAAQAAPAHKAAAAARAAATRAQAPENPVYCAFGDTFYKFQNLYTGNQQTYTYDPNYLLYDFQDGTTSDGALLCQVTSSITTPKLAYYMWAVKGTDQCLYYDATNLIDDFKQCDPDKLADIWYLTGGLKPIGGYTVWSQAENSYNSYNMVQTGIAPGQVGPAVAWAAAPSEFPYWMQEPHDLTTCPGCAASTWMLAGPYS